VEHAANGTIDWTSGEVFAKGVGAPPAQASHAGQARAMAERAAFIVALRNLLETVKGVRIDSETVVENFMINSDVIRTRVDGIVKGARIVTKQYLSDGSVEVLVGLTMKGAFLNAVMPDRFGRLSSTPGSGLIPRKPSDTRPSQPAPQQPVPPAGPPAAEKKIEPVRPAPPIPVPDARQEPVKPAPPMAPEEKKPVPAPIRQEPVLSAAPVPPMPPAVSEGPAEPSTPSPAEPAPLPEATVAFKGGVATGLVIDGRGLGLRPALLPRIIDPQGQEVYVGQVVTRTNAVEQGVAGYAKDVKAAANNFRVTDNPAVIKGLKASGTARTDIVIGQADAQSLRRLSAQGDFLQYCRVIIVY
jgi:hypothetical protein